MRLSDVSDGSGTLRGRMIGCVKRLENLVCCLCVLIVLCWFLQIFCFATFRIPSDSMYPTLQPGDNILVNKWVMGARIFDIWEAAEEKEVEIYRLPGLGKVKRNDVLVFHFPYPRSNDRARRSMCSTSICKWGWHGVSLSCSVL